MHWWIVLLVLADLTPVPTSSLHVTSVGQIRDRSLSKQYPDADWLKWCNYRGYSPGPFNLTVSKTTAPTAKLQMDALQTMWTHSDTTIVGGSIESGEEVAGAVSSTIQKLRKSKKIILDKWIKLGKAFIKGASVLAPILGIISDIMGAVIGVQTPTADDILRETNKAIAQLAEEVDNRMKEMISYVDEKVITLEKDITTRKYKFLYKYWSQCVKCETQEEVDLCQREAYRLITASSSEFLMFEEHLDVGTSRFPEEGEIHALSDEQRRRIEVNMISFRNYALLALFSLKTLEKTYDSERKKVNGGSGMMRCTEMRARQNDPDEDFIPESKQQQYCIYKEELEKQSALYEAYGRAAIVEIQIMSANRLKKRIFTDVEKYIGGTWMYWWRMPSQEKRSPRERQSQEKRSPRGGKGGWSNPVNLFSWAEVPFTERRVFCTAYIHQSMQHRGKDDAKTLGKCGFDVRLLEEGYEPGGETDDWLELSKNQYTSEVVVDSGGNDPDDDSKTERWCHNKIRAKQAKYSELEQPDIKRYWTKEVLKVVTCGKLLAAGTIKTCLDEELNDHLPEEEEEEEEVDEVTNTDINLINAHQGSTFYPNDDYYIADKAIDDDLTTYSATNWQDTWWSAELSPVAHIDKIQIYLNYKGLRYGHYVRFKVETRLREEDEWKVCKAEHDITIPTPVVPTVNIHEVRCDDTTIAQYLRISNGDQLKLNEVKVRGMHQYAGKYKLVGCFKDTVDRAITGGNIDYAQHVIPKCYERALSIGAEYFAIQYTVQCFTSTTAGLTYDYYGEGTGCVDGKGGAMRNSVYKVLPGLRCKGTDDGCCTSRLPCGIGDGDCDNNAQCAGSLVCGDEGNCSWGGDDNCCEELTQRNNSPTTELFTVILPQHHG